MFYPRAYRRRMETPLSDHNNVPNVMNVSRADGFLSSIAPFSISFALCLSSLCFSCLARMDTIVGSTTFLRYFLRCRYKLFPRPHIFFFSRSPADFLSLVFLIPSSSLASSTSLTSASILGGLSFYVKPLREGKNCEGDIAFVTDGSRQL